MTVTLYKCTSEKMDGEIILTYHDGHLYNILFRLKQHLTDVQCKYLFTVLRYEERILITVGMGVIRVEPIAELAPNKKIALFCDYYMKHVKSEAGEGIKYKVSAADSGKIKLVEVTETLLKTYFTSNNFLFKNRYSISNYVKYYNELRAEAAGANKFSSFPNSYDPGFEKKLPQKDLPKYWSHLKRLGLQPIKNITGEIVDWRQKNGTEQEPAGVKKPKD